VESHSRRAELASVPANSTLLSASSPNYFHLELVPQLALMTNAAARGVIDLFIIVNLEHGRINHQAEARAGAYKWRQASDRKLSHPIWR